ncbi:SURFEIT LOCUS domain containg PROTEIN,putative [Babesia bigemina]|uniref:SURF1-like protein n=1 Tax=Babesia bigemina TaxID=5866 RepID=A0A061D2N6_BABBI|nr:SURFEIT LOCUS domain containg PROTEIN,putative [Babesia bigemina]CDR94863.1 SURFEIT LOCUS domain containg PROTEIN,putative [Babesia bigemina]|eukprot:XP_012767049.1 SURFEIT LOCUS domain containg PROTEIN,putative [Babesia bigemina]
MSPRYRLIYMFSQASSGCRGALRFAARRCSSTTRCNVCANRRRLVEHELLDRSSALWTFLLDSAATDLPPNDCSSMSFVVGSRVCSLWRCVGSSRAVRLPAGVSSSTVWLHVRRLSTTKGELPIESAPVDSTASTRELDRKPAGGESELTLPRDGTPLRCTEDQWLYKPTSSEVDLFRNSTLLPPRPIDVEGSVIVRLVDLHSGVTSPVGQSVLYSEYGIRRGELLRFMLFGSFLISVFCSLGYWQLRRRAWKVDILNRRREALSQPLVKVESFAQLEKALGASDDPNSLIEYRCVECTGVLDTSCSMLVGPRPSLYESYGASSGYCVVQPLRFRDGSCVLVNLGWMDSESALSGAGCPELVTLRGILVGGEINDSLVASAKQRIIDTYQCVLSRLFGWSFPPASSSVNRPRRLSRDDSRNVYRYLDPSNMSSDVYSSSLDTTSRYALNAYDVLYHDDVTELPVDGSTPGHETAATEESAYVPKTRIGRDLRSTRPVYQRRQKSDYLLFYADPDTHTNYAYQWFLMAGSIAGMCGYKVLRVRRTLRGVT